MWELECVCAYIYIYIQGPSMESGGLRNVLWGFTPLLAPEPNMSTAWFGVLSSNSGPKTPKP